jgi:hypothetical protein
MRRVLIIDQLDRPRAHDDHGVVLILELAGAR